MVHIYGSGQPYTNSKSITSVKKGEVPALVEGLMIKGGSLWSYPSNITAELQAQEQKASP
jgi:hypothetical protein